MKKSIIGIFLLGLVLFLNACGDDVVAGTQPSPREAAISLGEPTTSNGRECIIITGDKNMQEIVDDRGMLDDLDAFLNRYIDNYTGIYWSGSGYVILFADDLDNWQTPEILTDVNFTVCRAENSYNEMAEIREYLNANFDTYRAYMENVTGWGIDTLENIFVVYLYDDTDEAIQFFRENVIDSPLIEFRQGSWDLEELD